MHTRLWDFYSVQHILKLKDNFEISIQFRNVQLVQPNFQIAQIYNGHFTTIPGVTVSYNKCQFSYIGYSTPMTTLELLPSVYMLLSSSQGKCVVQMIN